MFGGTFGLAPHSLRTPRMRKRMFLGTFGLGPNSVRTARMRKTNVFGHIRARAQFSPNSQNAENECFGAHSGLGPIQSKQLECGKRMFLGTFGLGPHSVRTAAMRKTNVFGHLRAWAQFSLNSHNAENKRFWAHSGLGPIQPEQPECGKLMFWGTFGLGPNSVRTARMRKTNVLGHIRAWAQFSPNSQNAENECFWAHSGLRPIHSEHPECENECFWAHSGLGPIQSEQPECGKRMFWGTFGLGPNSVQTARMRKTNVFGHIRAWAPFSPNSQNAENECFWAPSGLGPIQFEQPQCGKRMFLGTFTLGPNSFRTARMWKTKVFGHIRAWAQFSPNSRNAENECFWADSRLGPIQSEQPECGKRMFLGTFGLAPNSFRTAGMRKTNVLGHIRAWAQFSPNSQNAENECFGAHSGLGPIQSEQLECGKRMFLGTFGLAPHSIRTARMRKTNVLGHVRAWAPFSRNNHHAENKRFWAHSGLGPIQSEQPECGKLMFWGTFGLGPNSV